MILIGIGGGLGAITRYGLGVWVGKKYKSSFPLATLLINITGSFVLGYLGMKYDSFQLDPWIWTFFGVGFLGGYTTFSTFGNETITLLMKKKYGQGIVYVASSVFLSILAAYIGYQI